MPNTITSFTTFTPGTKARSSEVNGNFSNYRGDLLPINTDTATASTNTHHLGSTEHRWATAYLNQVNFNGVTTTADISFLESTSTHLEVQFGGTTKRIIRQTGNYTSSSSVNFSTTSATFTTISGLDISLNLHGGDIFVSLNAVENTTGALGVETTSTNVESMGLYCRFYQSTNKHAETKVAATNTTNAGTKSWYWTPASFQAFITAPTIAGSVVLGTEVRSLTTTGSVQVVNTKITCYEIF